MNSQLHPPKVSQQTLERQQTAAAHRLAAHARGQTTRQPRLIARIAFALSSALARDPRGTSLPASATGR